MKKFKKGLVFGKFVPFTLGHKYLVDTALENCDIVVLLVCSIESEKIPGYLRYDWARRIFSNEIKNNKLIVKHIYEELPQKPKDKLDVKFWQIWTDLFERELNDFDVVFTSEKYGDDISFYMKKLKNKDVFHYCVDMERETVPICGSNLMKNPLKNWKYLPEVERSFFIKKVCIVGPESVGKTTMTQRLSTYFNSPSVLEYGRIYCDERGNTDNFNVKDISNIAHTQLLSEEENALKSETGLLFCDTDLIITEIYSYLYCGYCPEWILKINRIQKYDLYLLLDTSVPFVQDGTREFGNFREKHFEIIREELYKRNLNYKIINSDNYDKRFELAVKHINNEIILK